jgi:hypothetical protein
MGGKFERSKSSGISPKSLRHQRSPVISSILMVTGGRGSPRTLHFTGVLIIIRIKRCFFLPFTILELEPTTTCGIIDCLPNTISVQVHRKAKR